MSATQINLSWNAVSARTGYLVNEWTGIAWQQIGSFGSGTTSDALTGLTPGTGYTLSVGAYNSSGTSWANYQGVTTPNDWFGEHMSDPTLRALARNDFERDGGITRGDMIGLLYQAASGAAVSAADIQDLQAMVAAAGTLNVPGYVAELASKVVNGNPANWILGGAFGNSGNLYAGAPASMLDNLIGDWFYGDNSISWQGVSYAGYVNGALFNASRVPSYTDVYQGCLGDCTLMASLAEVAYRRPDIIQNMFINNGDGTYTVRFFDNGSPDYLTVNTCLPGDGAYFARVVNGVLWPALAEKAIVQENEAGWLGTLDPGNNSYSAIGNGDPAVAAAYLAAITGLPNSGYVTAVASNLASAWQSGDLIVLCSGNTPDPLYIEHNHCYAMVGYNPSSTMPFDLFNPWGVNGGTDSSGQYYYGQVCCNLAALDDYMDATVWACGAVEPNVPEAVSTVSVASGERSNGITATSPAYAADTTASELTTVPKTSVRPQSRLAVDSLFAAWGDDAEPTIHFSRLVSRIRR